MSDQGKFDHSDAQAEIDDDQADRDAEATLSEHELRLLAGGFPPIVVAMKAALEIGRLRDQGVLRIPANVVVSGEIARRIEPLSSFECIMLGSMKNRTEDVSVHRLIDRLIGASGHGDCNCNPAGRDDHPELVQRRGSFHLETCPTYVRHRTLQTG